LAAANVAADLVAFFVAQAGLSPEKTEDLISDLNDCMQTQIRGSLRSPRLKQILEFNETSKGTLQ
jgi:hypothetical protein